ncbi:MAG: metal ABC transporter substrate-binding protein [Prochlorococcus sp.]|nr:metal ABC transporter substrate-binding protein [Prochlorococcus sp.]
MESLLLAGLKGLLPKAFLRNSAFQVCFLAILGLLAACTLSSLRPDAGAGRVAVSGAEEEEKPLVLTTFTVLADMAQNVAGDRLNVRSIVKEGAEIHGYQPTPSDLERAVGADLIVENGFGLELWARKFTAAAGDVPTLTLSDGMQPLLIEGDLYAGKPNPHAWMSPQRAMHYVDKLVDGFSQLDPAGAESFSGNAEIYKQKLQHLDDELRASLAKIPEDRRLLVSCEGAFTYLASDYGMEEAYLWPVNAESQVTPRRMANLIRTVKERGVPTIFCESTVSDKAQREVAMASGARFGGTFYVDSLSAANGPAATLLELQRHNVSLIRDGLSRAAEVK